MHVSECVYVCRVQTRVLKDQTTKGVRFPGTGISRWPRTTWCECWKSNLGPRQEQQVIFPLSHLSSPKKGNYYSDISGNKATIGLEAGSTRLWILHYLSFPFDLATSDVISRAKRFHSLSSASIWWKHQCGLSAIHFLPAAYAWCYHKCCGNGSA